MRAISNSKLGTDGKDTQLIAYNLLPKKQFINIDIHKKWNVQIGTQRFSVNGIVPKPWKTLRGPPNGGGAKPPGVSDSNTKNKKGDRRLPKIS